MMYTRKDAVLDHAKLSREGKVSSTGEAVRLLEDERSFMNSAGNMYLAALAVIVDLQNQLAKAEADHAAS